MAPDGAGGGASSFDHDLRALGDDERALAAARARRRQHWLEQQAAEEGSLRGVLLDLGERTVLLAVSTIGGRTLRGTIARIGHDFVVLLAPEGGRALVAIGAVTVVRPEPGSHPVPVGDRAVVVDTSLGAELSALAAERPWVSVRTRAGDAVTGVLRGTGRDVLVLRGDDGEPAYVPLAAVGDVLAA